MFPDEQGKQASWRISKNLNQLKKDGILKSKSYGLTKDKGTIEHLWSIKAGKISRDLNLTAPQSAVHRFKYDHEVLCGDVYALFSEEIEGWTQKKLAKGLIPDRTFQMGKLYFLEAEMGNHKTQILRQKIEHYKQFFYQTGQDFNVIFVMAFNEDLHLIEKALEGQPTAYEAASFNQLKSSIKSSYTVSYQKEQGRLLK